MQRLGRERLDVFIAALLAAMCRQKQDNPDLALGKGHAVGRGVARRLLNLLL